MAGHGGPPALVPPIRTYRAYFSFPETDRFSGNYQTVLETYLIDTMNAGAAQNPASVSQKVYDASQKGDPTAFLMWHATPGISKDCNPGRVLLLHSVSYYASWMVRPARHWDNKTFENQGDVSYVTVPLAVWNPNYLHLAPYVYVPSAAVIDTSLAFNPTINLLGPYGAGDAGSEVIRCCKNVYVPDPYVGLLSGNSLIPVEAWNRLQ